MRFSYTLSLLAATTSVVSAQKMVPTTGSSTFPACAVNCAVLLQTQSTCTPPNAITSTQLVYDNCFCQAPTVQDLYTTGETLCTAQCTTTADRQLLSTWFVNFCKQVGAGSDPVGGTGTSTETTASASARTQSTATRAAAADPDTDSASQGPWIKSHWQWIIMLIVLFFGLLGLGLGARWLKKRHDLKMAHQRADRSGFPTTEDKQVDRERALSPEIWGPHQHMAATKGYQYTPTGVLPIINEDLDNPKLSKSKGNRASRVQVTEVPPAVPLKDSKNSPV